MTAFTIIDPIAIADRRSATQIATLNRRDFAVVRPAHCVTLDLIP